LYGMPDWPGCWTNSLTRGIFSAPKSSIGRDLVRLHGAKFGACGGCGAVELCADCVGFSCPCGKAILTADAVRLAGNDNFGPLKVKSAANAARYEFGAVVTL